MTAQVARFPDGTIVVQLDPESALVLAGLAHRGVRAHRGDAIAVRQDARQIIDDIARTAAMSAAGHGLSVDVSADGHGNAGSAAIGGQWRDEITVEEARVMLHPLSARQIRRIAAKELGGRIVGGCWLLDRNLCEARVRKAG